MAKDRIIDYTTKMITEELAKLRDKFPRRADSEKRRGAREGLETCLNKTEEQLNNLLVEARLGLREVSEMGHPNANLVDYHQAFIHMVEFVLDTLKPAHLNTPKK